MARGRRANSAAKGGVWWSMDLAPFMLRGIARWLGFRVVQFVFRNCSVASHYSYSCAAVLRTHSSTKSSTPIMVPYRPEASFFQNSLGAGYARITPVGPRWLVCGDGGRGDVQ